MEQCAKKIKMNKNLLVDLSFIIRCLPIITQTIYRNNPFNKTYH